MTLPLEKFWDRKNRTAVLAASTGMILVIALVDWWTTPFVSLGFLYLFPIMLAAGFLPRPALVAVSLVCAVLSEAFSSLDPSGRAIRLIFEMLALAGCGLFASELLRSRRLSSETQERLRALVETSPAAIVILDQSGAVELANRAATDLMVPSAMNLMGQPIATFLPELQYALRSNSEAQLRASMQCQVHRGNGETFVAEVWFSTYKENGAPKLAAIIADVTEEQPEAIPPDPAGLDGSERQSLNDRQIAVLQLVLEGLPNSGIASRLEMTPSAIKNTLQQLFSKAGVNNRSQLVRVALERYRDLL
jgi:PAS domain S-box-containing protein